MRRPPAADILACGRKRKHVAESPSSPVGPTLRRPSRHAEGNGNINGAIPPVPWRGEAGLALAALAANPEGNGNDLRSHPWPAPPQGLLEPHTSEGNGN